MTTTKPILFSEIEEVIKSLNPKTISEERKTVLQPITSYFIN